MWGSLWSWLVNLFNPNKSAEEKLRGDGTNMEIKAVESAANALGMPSGNTLAQSLKSDLESNFGSLRPQSADTLLNYHVPQLMPNATSPIASASNVINYDESKSALDNMFGYAVDNNSASAYSSFLENKHQQEMADTAIARAIADAESQGISKYQLFQGGNMAAATPSSSGSLWNSYEKTMDRRESWTEKELAAIVAIVTATMNGAAKIMAS